MKKVFYLLLAVLALASCKKPAFVSGPDSVTVTVDGGSQSLSITVNRDWKITSSASWCTVSPSSGTASDNPQTITLRCDANALYDARTAVLTITAEDATHKVTVTQAQLDAILPDQDQLLADYKAQNVVLPGQSNVDFTVTVRSGQQWIKVVDTKALGKKEVTLRLEENKSGAVREGSVELSKGTTSATVQLRQAYYNAVLEKDVPGVYQVQKKDYVYRPEKCQLSRGKSGQDSFFRILDVEHMQVLSVNGIPAETPLTAEFPLKIRLTGEKGESLLYDSKAVVVGESDSRIWLGLDANAGLILTK